MSYVDRQGSSWTRLSRVLHWVIVALILLQWLESEYMEGLWDATTEGAALNSTIQTFGWVHIVAGTSILVAAVIRLADRIKNGRPPYPVDEPSWATLLAKITHLGIYACLLAMPSLGLAAWLTGSDEFAGFHTLLWTPMLVLIGVHIGGALSQHFIFHSDVLRRMVR